MPEHAGGPVLADGEPEPEPKPEPDPDPPIISSPTDSDDNDPC